MIIYIAGPYTKPDPVVNTREAIQVGEELIAKGHTPIIPHLCHLWHLVSPHCEEFWYEYGLMILPLCQAVFRMVGDSWGADREVRVAQEELNIPVYWSMREVPDAV